MNWEQVIDRFATRKPNPRCGGRIEWTTGYSESMHGGTIRRCYCTPDAVYSYGRHFPLAFHLGTDADGKDVFLKNGDRNTPTTNRMVAHTQSRCYGPTVSLSALEAARLETPTLADIVDWRESRGDYIYRDRRDGKFYREVDYQANAGRDEFVPPAQGSFVPGTRYNADFTAGRWHILGAVLIRQRGHDYLCSLDEGRYFVSKLRGPAESIEAAFDGLKPDPVHRAETEGKGVVRQGEWFFVPTGQNDATLARSLGISQTELRRRAGRKPLPTDRTDSNVHEVMQLATADGRTFAKGKVFHRSPGFRDRKGTLTGEHRTVNLEGHWYEVYRNTQREAFSMGGRFD